MKGLLMYVKNKLALLAVVTVAFVVGGITTHVVMASIPDSNGVIHGCITTGSSSVRIIDSATTSCTGLETALNWYQNNPPTISTDIKTVTTNYTITDNDSVIIADAGVLSSDFTIDLPTAVGRTGRIYIVKSPVSSGSYNPILWPSSGETIDGGSSLTISQPSSLTVVSDGSNWQIIQ